MSNIKLEEGIEIISKPSIRQIDQILILYRKFDAFMIGELELTLAAVKVLLVDKTKENVIDTLLDSELDDEGVVKVNAWGEQVFALIEKVQSNAKKK